MEDSLLFPVMPLWRLPIWGNYLQKWQAFLDNSPRFIDKNTHDALTDIDMLLFANTRQESLRIVDRYRQHAQMMHRSWLRYFATPRCCLITTGRFTNSAASTRECRSRRISGSPLFFICKPIIANFDYGTSEQSLVGMNYHSAKFHCGMGRTPKGCIKATRRSKDCLVCR